jgi:hypothetical protein
MTTTRRMFSFTLLLALFGLLAASLPAGAAPVCYDMPEDACGGRIFAEPEGTVSFVQHDNGEYLGGIQALAERFPRFVKVKSFSQLRGKETLSVGGREMYMIEVTDFDAPAKDKVPVVVSLSAHGPERAGLEGGVRYAEDLARWATDDPTHELRNGREDDSVGMPVSSILKKVHLYLASINPDGWAAGDIANGGVFVRGNDAGSDLNREFPTMGWTNSAATPLSEPESRSWDSLMEDIVPAAASDLHGELDSANNAFADLMLPAGEWDPLEQAREERLARHMKSNVERYFEEGGVVAGQASGVEGMVPAEYATGYDVVGYDASGFMGDYFTQKFGALEIDVEHFLSHMVPNSTWNQALEDAHVASVRAEIETLMVESLVTDDVRVRLDFGKTGYVRHGRKITKRDGYGGPPPPDGVKPQGYSVTPMRYFDHLSRYTTTPLRKIPALRLTKRSLRGLDSLVIAGDAWKRPGKRSRKAKVIERWVRRGGNLVLTDKGVRLAVSLGLVEKEAFAKSKHNAGHIDIEDFEDPYTEKVHHTASQTYYEVPLGFSINEDTSPHFTIDRTAWESAGGKTVAYITDESRVGLGHVQLGDGTVGIFGALLPKPTEKFDHFFGLANYAVTIAGGQILNNMIAFGR